MNLDGFILFDPLQNKRTDLPKENGNYIVTIRDITALPKHGCDIVTPLFREHNVIYTGITSSGLRNRIGNQHLGKNAGRSTLRLTIGCLLGYTPIPRDKNNPENGMVRFNAGEEELLLAWMKENLLFYYLPNESPDALEAELIAHLNPPLNLMKNYNPVNQDYRQVIRALRAKKSWRV